MNSSIPYLIALSLALTSVQAEDFRFNPPPAATVLRDDRAEALPEIPLVLDVIANDIGFRPSEDSLRLLGSSTCGQMRVRDARSIEYQADAACAGQEVRQRYSLIRSGAEIDASATIILRVADNPVEPLPEPEVEIAANTTTCPSIPGLNFTAIDTQLVKPHVLSGMTATEEQMELAPGHIAMVLADGDNVHDRTEAVVPDSRLITEFCIMPQQVQRAAGNSPGYSYNQVLANISELEPPSGWQLSLPTLWELLAASVHLFSHQDQQLYVDYMASLRDLELEWGLDINRLCPEASSLILGPEQTRVVPAKPFHAYCQRQNYSGGSSNYGYRIIARKIN